MNDSNLPPEQWRPLFDAIGVEFGYRSFATHAKMTHTSVWRFMRGAGTSEETARKIADAFRVPVAKVYALRGESVSMDKPFTLPDGAGRLNDDERDVIRAMVRALLNAKASTHVDQGGGSPDHTESGATLDALSGAGIAELQVDSVDDDGQQTG